MKNIFLIAALLSSMLVMSQQPTKYYHSNGKVSSEGVVDANGLASGMWVYYHDNGVRKMMGSFIAGQATSEWFYWDYAGRLEKKGFYKVSGRRCVFG